MRLVRSAAVLLGLAACVLPPPSTDTPLSIEARAELEPHPARRASIHLAAKAEDARLQGDSEAARKLAEQALSVDQRNPYAYLVLARTLAELGDWRGAYDSASEAERLFLAEEPGDPAWLERATRLREAIEQREMPPTSLAPERMPARGSLAPPTEAAH
jgi:Tfp pilus assembly protein PilF